MQRRLIRPASALVLAAVIGAPCLSLPAAGDAGPSEAIRPWAGGVGIGGTIALGDQARTGLCASAALYPGAWAGRVGIRLDARTTGDADPFASGLFTAGLTYEAAAARPRLALALHGEAGTSVPDPRAAVGGGVELDLWLVGPLALAVDRSAHILIDGLDSEIALSGSVGLRLAR